MTIVKTIFDHPFNANETLRPTKEQLIAFLDSASKDDRKGIEGSDLMLYRQLLRDTGAFGQEGLPKDDLGNLQNQIFYGVLRYSQFVHPHLLSAVELYKYQLHMLTLFDFDTPSSFILAADKTLSKLNKKKLDDVLRIVRLEEMINERKNIIAKLNQAASDIIVELFSIVAYIKDNLLKIQQHCEASLIMVSDLSITAKKERELIEDIKTRPQRALRSGKITERDLDKATKEVKVIADELSSALREDSNTLTSLYESMHEQVKKTVRVIDTVLEESKNEKNKNIAEQERILAKCERALVSLLSAFHPDQKTSPIAVESVLEKFVARKRKEMLNFLFEIAQYDRRAKPDRRSKSRRKYSGSSYQGPERRSGLDRRTGKNRRYQ
jgi:hypothetical protein